MIAKIIGTFVPTFVSIPLVGTSITFLIFVGILLVLAILYFAVGKIKSVKAVVGVIDELIGEEASYYKDVYEKEGLTGLIEQLQ